MNHDNFPKMADSPSEYARNGDLESDRLAPARGIVLGIFASFGLVGLVALVIQVIGALG